MLTYLVMGAAMALLLVPGEVSQTTAELLIAVTDRTHDIATVSLDIDGVPRALDHWEHWESRSHKHHISYQRLAFNGLTPNQRYMAQAKVGGDSVREARFTTLPMFLPGQTEEPFRVMLGSCFCQMQDESGRVGVAYFQLPEQQKPHVKFLCGDQVYLDSPWFKFSAPHSLEWLEDYFFDRYVASWNQLEGDIGFTQVLARGGNFFIPDDHEFWNNAPSRCAYASNTWIRPGRTMWRQIASKLYKIFQTERVSSTFSVGQVAFLNLDTRQERTEDRTRFLSVAQFAQLKTWLEGLDGPGILTVGQPVFAGSAGISGHWADWNLCDFDDYARVAELLLRAQHSIVVLTGDVHFGRIARCELENGNQILEIISSPLALVDKAAAGKWNAAPDRFPAIAIRGLSSRPVITDNEVTFTDNHFLILSFAANGPTTKLQVTAWPVSASEQMRAGQVLGDYYLR